ncbi:MAG: 50S ribosomal protein L25/general stress protein Ctc [Proteobacteria bacterium]|nr:MAG: 50S ribosomal protein L25/general stress protein Ctc [Pseudomonadota bacterium]
MANTYKLDATLRTDKGKGASRRLRRTGKIPAIVYGGEGEPVSISLAENQLVRNLQEEQFYSSIINLNIDGNTEKVLLRDLQRHPARPVVLHADLQRISSNEKVKVVVQLHFVNEEACAGVKQSGGKVMKAMMDLEIYCLPKDIPEFVEVDVLDLNLGESVHISDLKLPEGVESVQLAHGEDHDLAIATVTK